jgi:hypothetical protein
MMRLLKQSMKKSTQGVGTKEELPQVLVSPIITCYYALVVETCYELSIHHDGTVGDVIRFIISLLLLVTMLQINILIPFSLGV